MERLGGVHLKWYQRHISHMATALESAEMGDKRSACYHAYQAVSALLSGIVGLDPDYPGPVVKTLKSLLLKISESHPLEILQCVDELEGGYFSGQGRCVECADLLTDYLHNFLTLPPGDFNA
ncbi:HEPN domain-containing protein [Pyrobaculum aerophilum]|uniref:DNA-binding protein n=1 Tax=Pyrobaculum aerophilum TaxID=13773 RepID=A0A371R0Y0_9CREN|nr:HEPN domain-containing protein [Pyrobaculum aerophilum]RFA93508.1 DNA-binding protein [Pyrobaculum aerophilum]RFA96927.1 DNA-binding protein [Pyrobaculum aerophilum]